MNKKVYLSFISILFLICFSTSIYAETPSIFIELNNISQLVMDQVDYINFNTSYVDGVAEGRLQWNVDDGTLEVGLPGGNVNLQIGEENLRRVKANETISNGDVVYPCGGVANRLIICKADYSSIATSGAFGIATEDIAINQFGYINAFGYVRDMDTTGKFNLCSEGSPAWLSSDGDFQCFPPSGTNIKTLVGIVVSAHGTAGIIDTYTQTVSRLQGLSLVDTSDLSTGDALLYNETSGTWTNKNVVEHYAQTSYHNETTPLIITLTTEDLYYNVTGLSLDYLNGITIVGGKPTINKSNMYQLIGSISFSGGNSGLYRYNLFVNDVEEPSCGAMRTTSTSKIQPMTINCIAYLNAGDTVNMRVKDTTSPVQDVNIYTLTFNMVEV